MRFHQKLFALVVMPALLAPIVVHAQFAASPFHTFEVRGPNSLNFGRGPRVELGAFGPSGVSGTATRTGTELCEGPLSLSLRNLGSESIPTQAYGRYVPTSLGAICTGSWKLTLVAGEQQTVINTQGLIGATVLPFVGNNSLTSSSDGKVHTFNWVAVPGAESVTVQVWDRSLMPVRPAQLVSAQSFSATTTNFVIDLNQPGPYFNDRPYTLEVLQVDERNNAVPSGSYVKALSRSRTYFDFILPSQPLTGDPVFLPIVEYEAGNPIYTFTVTVDGTGTFVIDPDIAIGYVYQIGSGNPNFRTVTLPNVGDGNYLVEIFDTSTRQYRAPINAVAGQLVDFIAQGFAEGVSRFRVMGIEAAAGLDAANPAAFPTALQFMGAGTFTGTMIPITGEKTVAQNIACGVDIIRGLRPAQVSGLAQQRMMVDMLGLAARYQATPYRSLSLNALDSVIARIDGCPLRGSPDTVGNHGGAGSDFVTSCSAQSLVYACLMDGRAHLTAPPVR